jgi:hypothetical protein
MYGVYDSDSNATTLTRGGLVGQSLTSQTVGTQTLRFVNGQQVALPQQNGWFVDLNLVSNGVLTDPGERIVTDPRLLGGALTVITVQPSANLVAMSSGPHNPLDLTPSGVARERSLLAQLRPNLKSRHPAASLAQRGASASLPDRVVYVDTGPAPLTADGSASRPITGSAGYRDSWSAPHLWPVVLGITPPPTLTSCTLTPSNPTISQGAGQQFTYVGHYSDGSTQNLTGSASWSSSDPTVATIGGGGYASSTGLGTATITASIAANALGAGNPASVITCSTTLTVVPPPPPATPQWCAIWPPNQTIYGGQQEQFWVWAHFSDGSNRWVSGTWASSNIAVATINSGGLATSQGLGSTTITATLVLNPMISCTTTLTVTTRPTLVSIQVLPPNPTIVVGATKQFSATGIYSNGTTSNLTNVATWSSADIAVATVGVHGLATGQLAGTATITATFNGVSGSTVLTVQAPVIGPPPQCPNGPVSYLMEFNFAGGAFTTPVFNYNGPGTSMSALLPANGMLLGSVYASAEVFNNFAAGVNGNGGSMGFITESNQTILSIFQFGMGRQRFAWWEIR